MATLFPSLSTIKDLPQKPTEGELVIIKYLNENLDDSYDIYFNPYINGDRPDIVIFKENFGMAIIEVKDWNLELYDVKSKDTWLVKKNGGEDQQVLSPIKQVTKYTYNFFDLHSSELCRINQSYTLERNLAKKSNADGNTHDKWQSYKSVLFHAVFFYGATDDQIEKINKRLDNYSDRKFLVSDRHSLFNQINKLLIKIKSGLKTEWDIQNTEKNKILNDEIKRILRAEHPFAEIAKPLRLNKQQLELSRSFPNNRSQIKGVAGGGKTTVLAELAVNAFLSHKSAVLILCFNKTLKNFLRERIKIACRRNKIELSGREFDEIFRINNYHAFINAICRNNNISSNEVKEDSINNSIDINNISSSIIESGDIYKSILIDEIQDYEFKWIQNIENKFLDKTYGEMVVFGDEKQNIYKNSTSSSKVVIENEQNSEICPRGLTEYWVKLKKSYRQESEYLKYICGQFQENFLSKKYGIEQIVGLSQDLFGNVIDDSAGFQYKYYYLNTFDVEEIYKLYCTHNYSNDLDTCILSDKIESLRKFDEIIRERKSGKEVQFDTMTTFEKQEYYEQLIKCEDKRKTDQMLETIRATKKENFWLNKNLVISTIHSFKGLELDTVFLIINDNELDQSELWYTAITRCKKNLIVINVGNQKYDDFFKKMDNDLRNKEK